MIVAHTILGLRSKFSVERLKKFKESSHVDMNTFLPKSLVNF